MLFWSVMTAACGMANSFITLFLARIGVGVGEAGLSPAAYSMIADSFPPARRARALGVYAIGAIIGVGLAFIIGGAVIHWAIAAPPVVLPVVGELKTWQLAFFAVSLPGPLLVLAMLPLRSRDGTRSRRRWRAARASFSAFLRERWLIFSLLSAGYSLIGVSIAAYMMWAPAFMMRSYGWPIARVGAVYGSILLVFSTSRHHARRLVVRSPRGERTQGRGAAGDDRSARCWPCHSPSARRLRRREICAMATIAVMSLAFGLSQGLPAASLQAIAPNRLRARVMALYLLVGNIIAFTVGPTGVALISDYWLRDPAKIGIAIGTVVGRDRAARACWPSGWRASDS